MTKREEMQLLRQQQKAEKEQKTDVPNPIEKMLPPEQEQVKGQFELDEIEDGKYRPSQPEKSVVPREQKTTKKASQKNVPTEPEKDIPITKYGAKDKRYKAIKLEKKYPVCMEKSLYDDLELVAYCRKISVNQLMNEILKAGLDKKEVERYRKLMEQFK